VGIDIHEYSGVDAVSPFDVEAHGFGSSTQPKSDSATTTQAGDLLFGVAAAAANQASWTQDTGYALRESNTRSGTEDEIATSTGGYSATFTCRERGLGESDSRV